MNVFDMPVIGHEGMVEKVYNRLPQTKKKRIVKKWRQHRYSLVPRTDALIYSCGIICHPSIVDRVQEGINIAKQQAGTQNGSTKTEEETNHGAVSEGEGTQISTMDSSENS